MNDPVRPVIADSSGLISLLSQTDSNHQSALQTSLHYQREGELIITACEVFCESLNTIGKKLGHSMALEAGKLFVESELFIIEPLTEELLQAALLKFEHQPGSVSFTDCLVMAMADQYGTRQIFGFDQVFAQNGYLTPTKLSQAA